MKKKNMKTMITRILACALLVATLGLSLASCAAKDKVKDAARKAWDTAVDGAEKIYDAAKDKITMEQTEGIGQISLLSLYTGTETVDEKDVVYQIIQAHVRPDSATDKSTTWEVYWIDNQTGNEDANVTDYVTVMACIGAQPYTAQPGSNWCKVTCKQPFAGSTIGVRVTTVVGGFTADCRVTYAGTPSYLGYHKVLEDGYEHITGKITLDSGSETSFELALDNAFHNVGADFGTFEIVSTEMVNGVIKADKMFYNTTGEKLQETLDHYDISKHVSDFVTVTLEGDVLKVKVEKAIESWIGDSVGSPSGGNYFRFNSFADSGKPYFAVTVKDTVSGVVNVLHFEIESAVQSVSLSDAALTF